MMELRNLALNLDDDYIRVCATGLSSSDIACLVMLLKYWSEVKKDEESLSVVVQSPGCVPGDDGECDGPMVIVNCDNCNREFQKTPSKLQHDNHSYCSYDCRYYHQVFETRAVKDRSYRKIKFLAETRARLLSAGETGGVF